MAKMRKPTTGAKPDGKGGPVRQLLRRHPELSREQAAEISRSGLTVEQWQAREAEARERRRQENERRRVDFLRSRYPQLSHEQALEILGSNLTPEEYLARQAEQAEQRAPGRKGRKAAIDEILARHPELGRALAGQVVAGKLTLERARAVLEGRGRVSTRSPEEHAEARRRREERQRRLDARAATIADLGARGNACLGAWLDQGCEVEALMFPTNPFVGTLREVRPYMVVLGSGAGRPVKLRKLGCALLYRRERRSDIHRQIHVDLPQRALRQHPAFDSDGRYAIPGQLLVEGSPLAVRLCNGCQLFGTIAWVDHFQLMLALPEGGEVFLFRHGVILAQDGPPETGGSPTLAEFLANPPSLPDVLPTSLALEEISVEPRFDDYPVKDARYAEYHERCMEAGFQLEPLQVRRMGERFVLVDGYRRLTLAREQGYGCVPVKVV